MRKLVLVRPLALRVPLSLSSVRVCDHCDLYRFLLGEGGAAPWAAWRGDLHLQGFVCRSRCTVAVVL